MPRPVAYIAELLPPSAELIDKIHRKHNVTLDEVREAVILTDVESSVWDWHPDPARGWRLLVTAKTYVGRRLPHRPVPGRRGSGNVAARNSDGRRWVTVSGLTDGAHGSTMSL